MLQVPKEMWYVFQYLMLSFFIFGYTQSLLLHGLFSSCKWGYSLVAVHRLLTVVASLVAEHGGALGA